MNTETSQVQSCCNCCNWDVSSPNNRAIQQDKSPKNYPVSKVDHVVAPDGRDCPQNVILPTMQTNNWLIAGVKFAFANRKEGKWNRTECCKYLATMGIAEKIADNIESKLRFKEENPNSISNITDLYPYLWQTNYQPNFFINAPMHQLGHGVLSDIILELHKFLTSKNKATEFEKNTNEVIMDLIQFRLDWCKMKLYPKRQWVSENTFGFSRFIQYFYANFMMNTDLVHRDIMIQNAFILL